MRPTCTQSMFPTLSSLVSFMKKPWMRQEDNGKKWQSQRESRSLSGWGEDSVEAFPHRDGGLRGSSPIPSHSTRTSTLHDLRTGRRATESCFMAGATVPPETSLEQSPLPVPLDRKGSLCFLRPAPACKILGNIHRRFEVFAELRHFRIRVFYACLGIQASTLPGPPVVAKLRWYIIGKQWEENKMKEISEWGKSKEAWSCERAPGRSPANHTFITSFSRRLSVSRVMVTSVSSLI